MKYPKHTAGEPLVTAEFSPPLTFLPDNLGELVVDLMKGQGARLREARKRSGLTIEGLAAKTSLHFNTIGRIERGENEASIGQILTLATALDIPPQELSQFPPPRSVSLDDDEFAMIDMLDVRVSGGRGSVNEQEETIGRYAFRRSWLRSRGVQPEKAKCLRHSGDSMADKINDGDVLLLNTAVNTLERDGVYAIELDGLDYVKLLQRDFATGGVQIISYNTAYKPQLITAAQAMEMRITGSVVWHAGEL